MRLGTEHSTGMSTGSHQFEPLPPAATKGRSCETVLVSTTLYPMDIPPSLLPPVRDNFQTQAGKARKSKTYSYKLSHSKDKGFDHALGGNTKFYSVDDVRKDKRKDVKFCGDSQFGFDDEMSAENSPHYRPAAHGTVYVQNYKLLLRQHGARYRELFGHSPRACAGKPTAATSHRDDQSRLNETPSEQSRRLKDGGRFPYIRTDSIVSAHQSAPDVATARSKENSVSFANYDSEDEQHDALSARTAAKTDDVSDSLERVIHDNLNDVIMRDTLHNSTAQKRSSRRKGRLGDIMSPRHMEQVLETSEALLKFEEGLGYPYEK